MTAGETGDLVILREDPFNAETPLHLQVGTITPVRRFYVRSHFANPAPPASLVVDGAVGTPLTLKSPDDLVALPSRTLLVTLECAGNGRSMLDPKVPGEPWDIGAVGTAEWTGTPLENVLARAGVAPSATEVLFEGADDGYVDGAGRIHFARSLPVERALHDDTLLAYAMNGEPLTENHGAPLRLIVPGWYGVASVKWLRRISVLERPFDGYYQTARYVIDGVSLRHMEVRSVITTPREGEVVGREPRRLRGYCWSGGSPVNRVEVSVDGGRFWASARLTAEPASPYAWRAWEFDWEPAHAGEAVLVSRATDAEGRTQPDRVRWNLFGYANNAIRHVRVAVE